MIQCLPSGSKLIQNHEWISSLGMISKKLIIKVLF